LENGAIEQHAEIKKQSGQAKIENSEVWQN
jgi:hypothetical protein